MIRTQLLTTHGEHLQGGKELIERWQRDNSGYIWIDLLAEEPVVEKQFLLSMECHPLAVEDVQRFRHPPKTETFDNYTLLLYRGITEFNKDLTIQQMTIALFA